MCDFFSGETFIKVLKCYNFIWVRRRHNRSPAASFTNCVMALYLLEVHLQTFLSIPITQKCQILSCDTLVANERYLRPYYQCSTCVVAHKHITLCQVWSNSSEVWCNFCCSKRWRRFRGLRQVRGRTAGPLRLLRRAPDRSLGRSHHRTACAQELWTKVARAAHVVGGSGRVCSVYHLRYPIQCVQPWLPLMTSLLPHFTKWLRVATWNNCQKNRKVTKEIPSKWFSIRVWCRKLIWETRNGVRRYVWCVRVSITTRVTLTVASRN